MTDYKTECITQVLSHYKWLKPIPICLKQEIDENYEIMSGCQFMEYLNHKLYSWIIMEAVNETKEQVPKFTHWEDLDELDDDDDD